MSSYFIKISELPQHNVIIMDVPPNARHFSKNEEEIQFKYNRQIKTLSVPFKVKDVVGRYDDFMLNKSLIKRVLGAENVYEFNQMIERNDDRGFIKRFNPLIFTAQK